MVGLLFFFAFPLLLHHVHYQLLFLFLLFLIEVLYLCARLL
jgi:hypothetical protein